MARYRKIDVRIWSDAKVRSLSAPQPNAQFLWLYLLTSPDTTSIPGLFRAGEAGIAEALDWPLKGFREAFQELFAKGLAKADWKARLVFIPKAIKHNPPENPNVIKGWRVAWDELPECELKDEAYQAFKVFLKGFSEGFQKAFAEGFGKGFAKPGTGTGTGTGDQKPLSTSSTGGQQAGADPSQLQLVSPEAPKPRPPSDVEAVFQFWRTTMVHPKAKLDAKRERAVKDRLKDGYSVDDLKQAIVGCSKTPHNQGQNDRGERYDLLELICRDAAHVDRFMRNAEMPPVPKANACPNDISQEAHEFHAKYGGCQIDFDTELPITDPQGNPLPYPGAPFELATKKASVS